MSFCAHCGAVMPDDFSFCGRCGLRLGELPVPDPAVPPVDDARNVPALESTSVLPDRSQRDSVAAADVSAPAPAIPQPAAPPEPQSPVGSSALEFLESWQAHGEWVSAVAFVGEDRIVTTGGDGTLVISVADSDEVITSVDRPRPVAGMARAPAGRRFAIIEADPSDEYEGSVSVLGEDGTLLWSADVERAGTLAGVAWAADASAILVCVTDREAGPDETAGRIEVYSSADGSLRTALPHAAPETVVCSPDGRFIAADGEELKVWNVEPGHERLAVPRAELPAYALAFSPDSRRLASGLANGDIEVYDTNDWELTHQLSVRKGAGAENVIVGLAFTTGRRLVSASQGGAVTVWDFDAAECMQEILHTTPIESMAFHAARGIVACGCDDGTVVLWRFV